jgi:hypothetical protein
LTISSSVSFAVKLLITFTNVRFVRIKVRAVEGKVKSLAERGTNGGYFHQYKLFSSKRLKLNSKNAVNSRRWNDIEESDVDVNGTTRRT